MLYWGEVATMIECFNDVEVRSSGVIMSSVFDQIKKMYAMDPEMAGELAISAIELVLTGQISSDDAMIDMLLAPAKVINDHNVQRYENRKEGSKNKKIKDMKLDEIAEMLQNGMKQKEIAERLHISQQTVSYRMGLIRTQYPELMQDRGTKTAMPDESPVQTFYQNSECLPKSVQTKVDVYQKTKSTKSEDLVIL
jgi:predicted XRE-type DNA-binding protein